MANTSSNKVMILLVVLVVVLSAVFTWQAMSQSGFSIDFGQTKVQEAKPSVVNNPQEPVVLVTNGQVGIEITKEGA
jgi:hypothetical protein